MAPMFPLVIIVNADEDLRVARLDRAPRLQRGRRPGADRGAGDRGAAPRGRRRAGWTTRAAQDELVERGARRSGTTGSLPFAHNVRSRTGRRARRRELVPSDPTWPDQAQRIVARLNTACGHRRCASTTSARPPCPGLDAKDVIDVQVTVASLDVADELADALAAPVIRGSTAHHRRRRRTPTIRRCGSKRFHASADPGRPTNVHLRVDGWPNQQFALLFGDWLTANADVRGRVPGGQARRAGRRTDYADAKEPWFVDAYRRAWEWADATGLAAVAVRQSAWRRGSGRSGGRRGSTGRRCPVGKLVTDPQLSTP